MRGISLSEVVIALALALAVAAAGAQALAVAIDTVAWQPAAGELAARARSAAAIIAADLGAAGAGPIVGLPPADPASARVEAMRLAAWLPPVLPRVVGLDGADADSVAANDRLSVLAIGDAAPQAIVGRSGPGYALHAGPTCVDPAAGCGFRPDEPVLLLPRAPAFQLARVDEVTGSRVMLDGLVAEPPEAILAQAAVVSYRFDAARGELLRGRAGGRGLPLLDHLAAFEVELWGRRGPPAGPRWDAGASCVLAADGTPRLPPLGGEADALARLDLASLADGPWCGDAPFRYDADLLRVRRVRIRLRVVADAETARGPDPVRFAVPGRAQRPSQEVADLEVHVDVAPPALRGAP